MFSRKKLREENERLAAELRTIKTSAVFGLATAIEDDIQGIVNEGG